MYCFCETEQMALRRTVHFVRFINKLMKELKFHVYKIYDKIYRWVFFIGVKLRPKVIVNGSVRLVRESSVEPISFYHLNRN